MLTCFAVSVPAAELAVQFTDPANTPLADAVVYVASATGRSTRQGDAKHRQILQRNRIFEPMVTVVEKGTAVDFPNEDNMLHHVYSFSPAKRFEIRLYKGTSPSPVVFDKSGIVVLGCNVHDWMIAYVIVLDTPYYAKAGADGVAKLVDLPAGTHEVMAWYPGLREAASIGRVTLSADASQSLSHQSKNSARTRPIAPPLDPMRY